VRVAISATSKFHSFDLAREMHARGALAGIFTGYPRFKLQDEGLPRNLIRTFPYVHASYMALSRIGLTRAIGQNSWEYFDFVTFDAHVASRLPPCDVFIGQSGSSLLTGRAARSRGIRVAGPSVAAAWVRLCAMALDVNSEATKATVAPMNFLIRNSLFPLSDSPTLNRSIHPSAQSPISGRDLSEGS